MRNKFETNKSKAELSATLTELRSQLTSLTFQLADKKLKNTNEIKQVKRNIARVLTALNV
ncbi:50S ribosomal protein L29 [Candidatus Parcubacteria bacterium]|nr:50S ribosomal protein L29 [Candidatus Parcubacteria bacterium]